MAEPPLLPPDTVMALVHDGLRFSLASAPALIQIAKGDDVRRGLVAGYYANVLLGLDVHHHGEEEFLFPLLIERFPEEQAKIELGLNQHHDVVSFSADATAAVSEWGTQGDAKNGKAISALEALDEVLSVHLKYEETSIVPLEGNLTSEERRTWLALNLEHHTARLPDLREFFFTAARGRALLWEAVGEASFRDMIARSRQPA